MVMSHSKVTAICRARCKMLRGQAKYKRVFAFKKHEMVSPKAREPAAALGCDQWLSALLLPAPISWGHTAGGQVSVEVSHQHS